MTLRSKLSSLREYLTPINNESNFHTTGEISPEEFVKAGDYLVFKFPTWQWGTCPAPLRKKHLPADKQFLVTRHVPSYRRVSSYLPELMEEEEKGADGDDEWGIPCFNSKDTPALNPNEAGDSIPIGKLSIGGPSTGGPSIGGSSTGPVPVVNDLDDLIEDDVEDDVDGVNGIDGDGDDEFTNIDSDALLLRKYDLYISYSTSYRVPKMYLVGFNANGIPLLPDQMYEDISGDYKDKTATIENLPMSYNTTSVSIHPCKHSSVMKVFMKHSKQSTSGTKGNETNENVNSKISESNENQVEEKEGIRVDQYLVIFLKFIASVTPGIEYDFTMDAL